MPETADLTECPHEDKIEYLCRKVDTLSRYITGGDDAISGTNIIARLSRVESQLAFITRLGWIIAGCAVATTFTLISAGILVVAKLY